MDEAAAACAHLEELARAAKRAGDPGRIGPLRADIYLALLDGRWQHCNRDQIIADLLTRATSDTDDGAGPADPPAAGGPGTVSEDTMPDGAVPENPAQPRPAGGGGAAGGTVDPARAGSAPR